MASSNPATSKLPLSSNWKALQKTLKRKEPESSPSAATADASSSTKDDGPSAKRVKSDANKDTKDVKKDAKKDSKKDIKKDTQKDKLSRTQKKKKKAKQEKPEKISPSASLALWAEDNDISPEDLAAAYGVPASTTTALPLSNEPMFDPTASLKASNNASTSSTTSSSTSPPPITFTKLASVKELDIGRYIAIDCEMVGVGSRAERSALARVSIVNYHGHCVIDLFVKPKEKVTDWRTWVSGVSPRHMKQAVSFEMAQKIVSDLMKGRVVIGHAIKNDFDALLLSHPRPDTRDTSTCRSLKEAIGRGSEKGGVGLKKLAKQILEIDIQGGKHSSIEDARACMLLYRKYKNDFEKEHIKKFPNYDRNHLSGDSKGKGSSGGGGRREPRTKKPKKAKSKTPPDAAAKSEDKKLIISSE